jgi:hypothetical protein
VGSIKKSKSNLHKVCEVSFAYFSSSDPHFLLVCGLLKIKEKTPQNHMFERDWTTSSIEETFVQYLIKESLNVHV